MKHNYYKNIENYEMHTIIQSKLAILSQMLDTWKFLGFEASRYESLFERLLSKGVCAYFYLCSSSIYSHTTMYKDRYS